MLKQLPLCLMLAAVSMLAYEPSWERRIEPALAAPVCAVDVTAAGAWRDVDGYPAVDRAAAEDGMLFNWNGQVDWRNPQPRHGRVELAEALPIARGADNRVRLIIQEATLDLADDAEFMPLVILKDAGGNAFLEREFFPPDYMHYHYTCNDRARPRQLDLTLQVPETAATLSLVLEFRGNPMRVLVTGVSLSPALPKEKWDFEKVRTGIPHPDIRYLDDDIAAATPDKQVLSPEEIEALLANRPRLYPKLEKQGDRIRFTVNGEEEPFTIAWPPFKRDRSYLQNNWRMGYRLFMLPIVLGPRADAAGWPYNIWLDDGRYDFNKLAEGIRYLLSIVPEAKIVLYVRVTLPTAWAEKHPDAIHTNAKGERAVSEWSRVNRYGGEPPTGEREFYEACNYSTEFRDGLAKTVFELGRWLDESPEGNVVVGAYIHGGADTQWFYSYEPEFADYSPGTLKAYRDYLREKYHGSEQELSAAWGRPMAFDNVEFPPFSLRTRMYGPDPNVPRSPLMSYNRTEQEAADYNQFMSVGNTRRQLAVSRAFKEGSRGRLLVGTYWPVLPNAYPLAHGDFYEMVSSPDIDFVSRGGIPSAVFHGKMCVGEFDLRNVASGLDAWLDYDHPLIAKSAAEFRRYILAHTAAELAVGTGYHLWDMHGGWHWHPTAVSALTEAQGLTRALRDFPAIGENCVGVFMDEDAADQLRNVGQYYTSPSVQSLFMKYGWAWASGLERFGLPVRCYLQQDALDPNLVPPRVAIFVNPLTMTLEQGAAIRERFENSGRVVVYMLAPGLAAPGTPDNPSQITGFHLVPDQPGTADRVLQICAEDPLLAGLPAQSLLGSYLKEWDQMAWTTSAVAASDSPGKVLAKYAGTDFNGMLVDRSAGCTKVWIGAPGAINRTVIRNMAREAGLQPMLENDAWLFYGAGILGVGGQPRGGVHRVNLPAGVKVLECLTGHAYDVQNGQLVFTLGTGEVFGDVAVFAVQAE